MSDPKYQNLPYIAFEQPDVYESAELPESDQVGHELEEHEDIVEKLLVDPKDAFCRFNKSSIDGKGANFSDEAVHGRAGYSVYYDSPQSYERDGETVEQRLERLRAELKEIQDIAKMRSAAEVNPATLLSDVEMLQRQVESFFVSPIGASDKNSVAYGQLLTQLKSDPSGSSGSATKASAKVPAGDAASNQTLYELHYTSSAFQSAKEANLESRITQIETLVGSADDAKALSEGTGSQSIMESLSALTAKLHLLDEDNVSKLSARLQILLQTLTKVKESSSTAEARSMEKINELYELVKKWDSCADSLPSIVDRLYTLQDLHQQAMEFSSSLKTLESAQNELSQNVKGHQALLKDVQKSFSDNVDIIKSNVESLDKRISNLKR